MNKRTVKTLTAKITLGQQIGFSEKMYSKDELIKKLQDYQKQLSQGKIIYLSAKISSCEILLNEQVEPHFDLEFINYPPFLLEEKVFREEVNALGEFLMRELGQKRLLIVYPDECLMLEVSEELDPKVGFGPCSR